MRTISEKGLNWLKGVEKLSPYPYDDQTGKPITQWCKGATIGYGHLIRKSEWSKFSGGIPNDTTAEQLLLEDLEPATVSVRQIPHLTENQFDACVILAFNIGVETFETSTVYKYLCFNGYKSQKYPDIRHAWEAFNKSQGKFNRGVMNRRLAEFDMFEHGVYRYW